MVGLRIYLQEYRKEAEFLAPHSKIVMSKKFSHITRFSLISTHPKQQPVSAALEQI